MPVTFPFVVAEDLFIASELKLWADLFCRIYLNSFCFIKCIHFPTGFPGGSVVKTLPANAEDVGAFLGWEDPPEEEMATHSSILTWKIQWTEKHGGLQSMGSQRVGHD